jgi:hypothetical protein
MIRKKPTRLLVLQFAEIRNDCQSGTGLLRSKGSAISNSDEIGDDYQSSYKPRRPEDPADYEQVSFNT